MFTTQQQNKASSNVSSLHPAIVPDESEAWRKVFEVVFEFMLRQNFHAYRVKGVENFNLRNPHASNVFIASHCGWWDGQLAYLLCRKIFNADIHMMIEELHRMPLLAKIGAFSVEKDTPQNAIRALQYSVRLLKNPKKSLWIYPQGIVKPQDCRPLDLASGVAYMCSRLDQVNIIPIAHRYAFGRETKPEIFVEVGLPIVVNNKRVDKKDFTAYLERELTTLLDNQRSEIASLDLEEYRYLFRNKLSLIKRAESKYNSFIDLYNRVQHLFP